MPDPKTDTKPSSTLPEKVTLTVSVFIVLSLVGFLAYQGFAPRQTGLPMAEARVLRDRARQHGETWVIPVEVKNTGGVPLNEVSVSVEMIGADGQKAEVEMIFGYLAERAAEEAFVVADQEPSRAKPQARVRSFKTQRNAQGY